MALPSETSKQPSDDQSLPEVSITDTPLGEFLEETGDVTKQMRDVLFRRFIPLNTPTPGRSTKLRDVFILSGTVSSSSTVVTVANTITETNLRTFTFNPNGWHAGMVVRVTAFGTYSTANATDTVTIRVGLGNAPTTEINSIVNTAATVTTVPWNFTWVGIVGFPGTSGTLEAQLTGHINNVQKDDANTATVTLNTTVQRILAITAQWSNALAGNTISVRQTIYEILR